MKRFFTKPRFLRTFLVVLASNYKRERVNEWRGRLLRRNVRRRSRPFSRRRGDDVRGWWWWGWWRWRGGGGRRRGCRARWGYGVGCRRKCADRPQSRSSQATGETRVKRNTVYRKNSRERINQRKRGQVRADDDFSLRCTRRFVTFLYQTMMKSMMYFFSFHTHAHIHVD